MDLQGFRVALEALAERALREGWWFADCVDDARFIVNAAERELESLPESLNPAQAALLAVARASYRLFGDSAFLARVEEQLGLS